MSRKPDDLLRRTSDWEWQVENRFGIPARILARDDVPIESQAIDELQSVLELQSTVESIAAVDPDFFPADRSCRVREVVLTPDFHKGAGVPIGTVLATEGFAVPQAVGNDINCGMRLAATTWTHGEVRGRIDRLEQTLRKTFFEGGRGIPMTPRQREGLLREGLPGLLSLADDARKQGLWASLDANAEFDDLANMHGHGGYPTTSIYGQQDYIQGSAGLSYDAHVGSLGGGNHFAEIQYVRKVLHGAAAHAWGLTEGQVVVMIHAGSLGVGHTANHGMLDVVKAIYPASLAHPENALFPLPDGEPFAAARSQAWTALYNAANFAFGNRFFLARMVWRSLVEVLGDGGLRTVYDAPHNLMWDDRLDGAATYIHRKGATPAAGWEGMQDTAYAQWGEPVIVPGSMGAPSYLLLGQGNRTALCSACHGAGRQISRGAAMHADDRLLDAFLEEFRVVTPLDPRRPDVRRRRDLIDKWRQDLKKEAPFTYKDVGPVIATLQDGAIAQPVVELYPLMTVKG